VIAVLKGWRDKPKGDPVAIDGIAARLKQLGDHVKSLGPPWRAELRGNDSFRLLYAEGKVSYWELADNPLTPFLDMAEPSDMESLLLFSKPRPPYKGKAGLRLDVYDFAAFEEWTFSEAPNRKLDAFDRENWRARQNKIVKVWE
jgi:hypothetical protein